MPPGVRRGVVGPDRVLVSEVAVELGAALPPPCAELVLVSTKLLLIASEPPRPL